MFSCQQSDDCFFLCLCDLFRHVRCVVALPHGRVQRADVPVHDPDALAGGTGVFLRPLPNLNALDEQPQQLGRQLVDGGVLLGLLDEGVHIGDRGFQPL